MVRRILVHRVIVSLISVPCRARGSATAIRRILVTSPAFSHHDRRAVLVFARVKMCGHLSLVHFIKCSLGKPQTSFPRFPSHREIGSIYGHLLAGGLLSHGFPAAEESVGYMGIFLAGGLFSPLMPLLSAG